ncbi:titin isoform X2 [Oreochromis niloticus]|uniref:titin isoform X2 n=1 Tax=Oreochromis niloticus TaxID=8128 RepID=UPI000DF35FEC|nr:titin isoform X2 [Oreochromis niloticus]
MGATLLCELGLFLLCTLLSTGHTEDAVLTIEPSWSSFFIGESVTFKCDMNEGKNTDWEYKIIKNGQEFLPYKKRKDYRLHITSTHRSGEYQCIGRRKKSRGGKNSNTASITVLNKPRATLTAGTTIIPVGGSVTLTCSVQSSDGWKYEWFRRTQTTNEVQIRDQQNRDIRVSQGGIYSCRGTRGNPVYYTDKSDGVTIEITFSNKVVVKQQPNWPQIFRGETITLTCEVQEGGETTEWEYEWRGPRTPTQWTHNNDVTFRVSESSSGDYMCKSRRRDDSYSSTEWSEAFTLSVSSKPRATLTAGTTIIPVGGSVTLTCSVQSSDGWKYEWFRRTQRTSEGQIRDKQNRDIRVSQGGIYSCRGTRGNPVYYTDISDDVTIEITFSNKVVVKQQPNWPQIFRGETITLTCEVQEGGETTEWEYEWRGPSTPTQWTHNNDVTFRVSESSSGDYMCKSRHRDDSYSSTEWSEAFTLSVSSKPRATLTAGTTIIPVGGSVTLTCSVQSSDGWKYEWFRRTQRTSEGQIRDKQNRDIRVSQGGIYRCRGTRGNPVYYTYDSYDVTIKKTSDKPRATLAAGTTIIPVGGSVTLTCSVQSSDGWKYEWFRRTQRTSEGQIRDKQNRDIRVSQGGIYSCRGTRGNPVYYTDISDDVTIEITFSNKVAVKQQPNWPQIFRGETITLTCEVQEGGETTEWEYEWRGPRTPTWWTYNNDVTFRVSESSSGDYMCKSRRRDDSYSSTEWSEAFTLSVSTDQPKAQITSDMRDIPVGGSVTLTCSVNPSSSSSSSSGWKYYWYRDEKSSEALTTQDAVFHSNGQISVSQEGLYRCRGGRGNLVYYTEDSQSVRIDHRAAPEPESSSFLTPLIVGLVCGVLLILLLLLLCRFKQSKDSFFARTRSTNQSSAMNHMIKDEAQHSRHASTVQGDACVYESIKDHDDTQNDDSVLYAEVSHDRAKTKKDNDDSLLYAQVYYSKAKPKRHKGKPAPAAVDETVYSEVKSQTALGNCAEIK